MTEDDTRPIEARVEAAFDRFNRAVILGMEPSPVLIMEALEAEGVRLSLTVPDTLAIAPSTEAPTRADSVPSAGRPSDPLYPGRTRALF